MTHATKVATQLVEAANPDADMYNHCAINIGRARRQCAKSSVREETSTVEPPRWMHLVWFRSRSSAQPSAQDLRLHGGRVKKSCGAIQNVRTSDSADIWSDLVGRSSQGVWLLLLFKMRDAAKG